jgi:hypothetical protein
MEEVFYPEDCFIKNNDFYDVAQLGYPLQQIISNISIKICQGNTIIDLMDYFDILKTGTHSNDKIVKNLIIFYCKLQGQTNFSNVKIVDDAFREFQIEFVYTSPGYIFESLPLSSYKSWAKGLIKSNLSKITTIDAINKNFVLDNISTYEYHEHLYPNFDCNNYIEEEIINLIEYNLYSKFHISNYTYLSNNNIFMKALEDEEVMSDELDIILESVKICA